MRMIEGGPQQTRNETPRSISIERNLESEWQRGFGALWTSLEISRPSLEERRTACPERADRVEGVPAA